MTLRRFLACRFLAVVLWLVLVLGAIVLANAATQRVQSAPLRFLVGSGIVAVAFLLGAGVQRWVLHRIDPDGRLREAVRRGL